MGMFDSIYFNCPKCGNRIEAQSKSGECLLNNYDYTCVPADVAEDVNRYAPFYCDKCESRWRLQDSAERKIVRFEIVKDD